MNVRAAMLAGVVAMAMTGSLAVGATWSATDAIQDGDFSADPYTHGWTLNFPAYYSYPSSGNPGPGLVLYYPEAAGLMKACQDVSSLTAGVAYKLVADTDYYGDVPRSGDVRVYLNVYDGAGQLLNSVARNGGNGWITLQNEFVAPADGKIRVELTGQTYWWETEAYWDNVVLYSSVPEPMTLAMLAMGPAAMLRRRV